MKDGHCEAIGNPITAQTVFRGVCHSSDLNVMQKDLIGHTTIVFFTDCNNLLRNVACMHMVLVDLWKSLQSMKIGMSNGISSQTCSKHPMFRTSQLLESQMKIKSSLE